MRCPAYDRRRSCTARIPARNRSRRHGCAVSYGTRGSNERRPAPRTRFNAATQRDVCNYCVQILGASRLVRRITSAAPGVNFSSSRRGRGALAWPRSRRDQAARVGAAGDPCGRRRLDEFRIDENQRVFDRLAPKRPGMVPAGDSKIDIHVVGHQRLVKRDRSAPQIVTVVIAHRQIDRRKLDAGAGVAGRAG